MKAFRELQSHLAPRWTLADGDGPEPRDIVVVPSLSFDGIDSVSIDGVIHYEERMLFTLNLLRHPAARLVYVSSAPIHPAAVDYILSLISGIPNEHMRQRLTVLSLYDSSLVPLAEKLLQRPRVIERIRGLIRPECGLMTCFTVSELERSLAVALGVPLYGVDPDLAWLGTKTGSRWAFRESGVPLLPGAEDLNTEPDLVEAIDHLWTDDYGLERVVVKQNTGFSGQGNAILGLVALDAVSPRTDASREAREQALSDALPKMRFVDPHQTWDRFKEKLEREVESLSLVHVPSDTEWRVARRSPAEVESVRRLVLDTARAIENQAFEPRTGRQCNWCHVKPWCPAYADQFPANWPEQLEAAVRSPSEVAGLADALGEALATKQEAEERIRTVQEKLISWFEATGQRAVAGSSFRVQASRSEKTALTCGDDELRALLEPAGLWEEILAPAYHLKTKLLDRPELPMEIRGALDERSEARVSWRLTPRSLPTDDEGNLT